MLIGKILVPLDGSKLGETALPYAVELAGALGAEIDLLGVCEADDEQQLAEYRAYIGNLADRVKADALRMGWKVVAKPLVLKGHAAEKIADSADKERVDLIVMATHGRSGILSWAMGGIIRKVLGSVNRPVLLVRAGIDIPRTRKEEVMLSRLLLPLDGSRAGAAALPYVKEIASGLKSDVTLLNVVETGQHVHTIGGIDYIRFADQQIEVMRQDALKYLKRVKRRFAGSEGMVSAELRLGDPADEIMGYTTEADIRLVAMSTYGHSGAGQHDLGGVANKVLHHGKTPILLVRAPGAGK